MTNLILLHTVSAFLSLLLLVIRGSMQLAQQDWRAYKLLKIAPHLVDTLLISSALILAFTFGFNLWVVAKFICFTIYVICAIKFFNKKVAKSSAVFFLFSLLGLITAIYLGYSH